MTAPSRTCPTCETPVPPWASFCPQCGDATPTQISGETEGAGSVDVDEEVFRDRLQQALGDSFELREQIGRGGFGAVYAAWDTKLEREVAIKALRHDLFPTRALRERFEREAKAVAKLRHPNILPVYAVGEGAGLAYMVMPRIAGETLREYLNRERQLAADEAVRIASAVAEALQTAHDAGVIHRDVKPENILLEGKQRRVLLMDFGIAKAAQDAGDQVTHTGAIVGTPAYMSPEQASGERTIDGRSDTYALGCVLYEMLAGEPPFTGPTTRAVIAKHIGDVPPSLEVVRPGLPPTVYDTLARALAKMPADRLARVSEVATALRADAVVGRPSPWTLLRRRWRFTVAGAVALLLVAFAVTRLIPPSEEIFIANHRQVTFSGQAWNPRLSPDGALLVFEEERRPEGSGAEAGVWVYDLATEAKVQLTESGGFWGAPWNGLMGWTADESSLLVRRFSDTRAELRAVPRVGGAPRVLWRAPNRNSHVLASDGVSVTWVGNVSQRVPSLLVSENVRTGASDTVLEDSLFQWFEVDWSPDSAAFVANLMTRKGDAILAAHFENRRLTDTLRFLASVRWGPSGRFVYGIADGKLVRTTIASGRFGPLQEIELGGQNIEAFDISGDGRHIAYQRSLPNSQVMYYTADSEAPGGFARRQVTTGTGNHLWPVLSPDGQIVAYVRNDPGDIYVSTSGGDSTRRLTYLSTSIHSLTWSPDGRWIGFVARQGDEQFLMVVDIGGAPVTRLTTYPHWERSFHQPVYGWSADGATILLFREDRDDVVVAIAVPGGEEALAYEPIRIRPSLAGEAPYILVGSPDGSSIAVVGGGVRIVNPADLSIREITDDPCNPGTDACATLDVPLVWREDDTVFFLRLNIGSDPYMTVMSVTTDGSDVQELGVIPDCYDLSMSQNGQHLTCSVFEQTNDIWIADIVAGGR